MQISLHPRKKRCDRFFVEEIFPVLTPLAFDSAHPFPFISNLSLNLAIIVRDLNKKDFFARVKVPTNLFSRLVRIPPAAGKPAVTILPEYISYISRRSSRRTLTCCFAGWM